MLTTTKEELFYYIELLLSIVYCPNWQDRLAQATSDIHIFLSTEKRTGSILSHRHPLHTPELDKLIKRLFFNLFFVEETVLELTKDKDFDISLFVKDKIIFSNEIDLLASLIKVQEIKDESLRELFNQLYKTFTVGEDNEE
jgi:hypothetical protein